MAYLGTFNADDHEPRAALDAIPAAKYRCEITQSELKPTKKLDGKYLELELQVLDGPYKGRRVWDRLNLQNRSPEAVEIAKSTLSAVCRAVGVTHLKDSVELHQRPLLVSVGLKRREDTGEHENIVRGYAAVPPGVLGSPATPATPPAVDVSTRSEPEKTIPAEPDAAPEEAPEAAPWSRADADNAADADDEKIPI